MVEPDSRPSHKTSFQCFSHWASLLSLPMDFPWRPQVPYPSLAQRFGGQQGSTSPLPPRACTRAHTHTHTRLPFAIFIYNALRVKKQGCGTWGWDTESVKGIGLMTRSSQLSQNFLRIFSKSFYKQTVLCAYISGCE